MRVENGVPVWKDVVKHCRMVAVIYSLRSRPRRLGGVEGRGLGLEVPEKVS